VKRIVWAISLALAAVPASPAADRVPILLELFTSEGCSSCPPADALLETLNREQPVSGAELVVVSEHVDYWNRLGWKDPFSSALFSRRQQEYARSLGVGDVYTPQLVIDGRAELIGSDRKKALSAIQAALREPKAPIEISVSRENDAASLHVSAKPIKETGSRTLFAIVVREKATSQVVRGENEGRRLSHVSVAESVQEIGKWKSGEALNCDVSLGVRENGGGPRRVIVFAQDHSRGRVTAVAQARL